MPNSSVTSHVNRWLGSKDPLTLVTLAEAYEALPGCSKAAVRAAYYHAFIGSGVADQHHAHAGARSDLRKYFGVRFPTGARPVHLDLTLPGLSRSLLRDDAAVRADQLRAEIAQKYGSEVTTYWMGSAQHRSVTVASRGMDKAKQRDAHCRLCAVLHAQGWEPLPDASTPTSAQHLLSRKASFWRTVLTVEADFPGQLFTDAATIALRNRLRDDKEHGHASMIVRLCQKHDRRLQALLGRATIARGPLALLLNRT